MEYLVARGTLPVGGTRWPALIVLMFGDGRSSRVPYITAESDAVYGRRSTRRFASAPVRQT